jgi:hypothetical protein
MRRKRRPYLQDPNDPDFLYIDHNTFYLITKHDVTGIWVHLPGLPEPMRLAKSDFYYNIANNVGWSYWKNEGRPFWLKVKHKDDKPYHSMVFVIHGVTYDLPPNCKPYCATKDLQDARAQAAIPDGNSQAALPDTQDTAQAATHSPA